MGRALRIGFLMDAIEGLQVHHDSTFALMLEAQKRGHRIDYLRRDDLFFAEGETHFRHREVAVSRAEPRYRVLEEREAPLRELDVLFVRLDPPFDLRYLCATQLIELAGEDGPLVINAPRGLRDANEKLFALLAPGLAPPSLVTSEMERILDWVAAHGRAVLKPLEGYAGRGVLLAGREDPNLRSLVELSTDRGQRPILVQQYLPEAAEGDKRIIVLEGEPIGAVLRVARPGEFRANMAAGGRPTRTGLTSRDREICAALAPGLRERGLVLVGIDVIGSYLTEVNVTSPTGLVEIDALDGVDLEARILEWAEARARR